MNNSSPFTGTGHVLRFTLVQMFKSKSNILSLLVLFLFALLSIPISSLTTGSLSLESTVHVSEDSRDTDALLEILENPENDKLLEDSSYTLDELMETLQNYTVTSFSEEEYLTPSDSVGFDASFSIQYVYSILVMVLCLLSASFVIHAVIEEKDSKLIELLMVSVQPLALLLGKIIAIMIFVVVLLLAMCLGFVLSNVLSTQLFQGPSLSAMLSGLGIDFSMMNVGGETIVIVLISLLLAFATYVLLAALIGTCCSTIDEVEPATMTVTLLIMAGYILSCVSVAGEKGGVFVIITSLLPVVSTFCAPVMYICAKITLPVLITSWVIQAVILAALAVFSAKIYRNLLLYRGTRLKLGALFSMYRSAGKEGK